MYSRIRSFAIFASAAFFPSASQAITYSEYSLGTARAWDRFNTTIDSTPGDRIGHEIATLELDAELDRLWRHLKAQLSGIKFPGYFEIFPRERYYDEWYREWPTLDTNDRSDPIRFTPIFELRFGAIDPDAIVPDHGYAFIAPGPLTDPVWSADWALVGEASLFDDAYSLSVDLSGLDVGLYYLAFSENVDIADSGDFSNVSGTANALVSFSIIDYTPVPLPSALLMLSSGVVALGSFGIARKRFH